MKFAIVAALLISLVVHTAIMAQTEEELEALKAESTAPASSCLNQKYAAACRTRIAKRNHYKEPVTNNPEEATSENFTPSPADTAAGEDCTLEKYAATCRTRVGKFHHSNSLNRLNTSQEIENGTTPLNSARP